MTGIKFYLAEGRFNDILRETAPVGKEKNAVQLVFVLFSLSGQYPYLVNRGRQRES